MLINNGILARNNEAIKNKFERRVDANMRESISKKFTPPNYFQSETWDIVLRQQNPAYLGSTIFQGQFSDPGNSIPELPILENYKQIKLSGPTPSHFKLFYSLSDLTNLSLDMELKGGMADVLVTKINSSYRTTESKKLTISMMAGLFENELAKIYDRIKSGHAEEGDIGNAIDLWNYHTDQKNPAQGNSKILKSFKGLVVSEKTSSAFSSKVEFNSNISGQYKAVPFVSFEGEANAEWRKETKGEMEYSVFDYYIKKESIATMDIPTVNDVLKTWDKFNPSIDLNPPLLKLQPDNDKNSIKLEFGPITSNSHLRYITPKLDEFIGALGANEKIIKSVRVSNIDLNAITKRAFVSLAFVYNDDFIKDLKQDIKITKPLKVSIGNKNGEIELSRTYNISLYVDAKVIPRLADPEIPFPEAIVTQDTHEWKFNIRFDNPDGGLKNEEILSNDILFKEDRLKFLLTPQYFRFANCKQKGGSDNLFEVNIKMVIPKDKITVNDYSVDVLLNLKPRSNSTSFVRKFPVTLSKISAPKVTAASQVIIQDKDNISDVLNPSNKLKSGESITDLLKKYSSIEQRSELTDILIKEFEIRFDPAKGYVVPAALTKPDLNLAIINMSEKTNKDKNP